MLREHGAQRPTVFELLNYVHRLRGTKSKFTYNIPAPSSILSRQSDFNKSPAPNHLNNVITYTSPPAKSALSLYQPSSRQNQSSINQGIQARDRVLEAIAPMRRGRPDGSRDSKNSSSSRNPSPQKASSAPKQSNPDKSKNWLDGDFGLEQDRAWKAATENNLATSNHSAELGWNIGDGQKPQKEKTERSTGFGDDFSQNVLNSLDSSHSLPVPPRLSPRPNLTTTTAKLSGAPIRSLAHTGGMSRTNQGAPPSKDAFEGLGLMTPTSKPAPTMGEARKLRTGLAFVNSPIIPSDYKRQDNSKISPSSRRPSLSPRPNYLSTTPSHPKALSSTTPSPGTSKVSSPKVPSFSASGSVASTTKVTNGLATESRFPSLEELDARLIPSVNLLYPSFIDGSRNFSQLTKNAENQQLPSRVSYIGSSGTGGNILKPSITPNSSHSVGAIRSEQVSGVGIRESKQSRRHETDYSSKNPPPSDPEYNLLSSSPRDIPSRSVPVQKHRATMSMQASWDSSKGVESTENTSYTKATNLELPQLPPRSSHSSSRDWLTGDDDHGDSGINIPSASTSSEVPVLRGSPSKRASYIELDKFDLAAAQPQHVIIHDHHPSQEPPSVDLSSPTVSKFKRTFPAVETIDSQSLHPSDVSDLIDDRSSTTTKDTEHDSSSADEGPEDPRRLKFAGLEKTSRPRGRQSSVHDLVYQYGGGATPKDKEYERERERVVQHSIGDYVPQQSNVRSTALVFPTQNRNKTPSPKPPPSPSSRSLQHHQSSTQANNSQLKAGKTPIGRTRPQSMLIFPSKSEDSSLQSPGLVPPDEPIPRARRTSISEIVDRFEAIGGKSRSGGPPSPLPKSTRTTSISVEPRRIQKLSLSTSSTNVLPQSVLLSKTSTSMSNDPSSHSNIGGSDSSKSHSVSMEPSRQATGSPSKPRKSLALEKSEMIHTQSVDNATPRPRRISRKAEPFEPVVSQSVKTSTEIFTPKSPHRKSSTLFGTDSLPPSKSEDRSSSPERPYQGVGKLIDQWQKKTAEADSHTTFAGKRGSFVAKRAGIMHGDDERGQ